MEKSRINLPNSVDSHLQFSFEGVKTQLNTIKSHDQSDILALLQMTDGQTIGFFDENRTAVLQGASENDFTPVQLIFNQLTADYLLINDLNPTSSLDEAKAIQQNYKDAVELIQSNQSQVSRSHAENTKKVQEVLSFSKALRNVLNILIEYIDGKIQAILKKNAIYRAQSKLGFRSFSLDSIEVYSSNLSALFNAEDRELFFDKNDVGASDEPETFAQKVMLQINKDSEIIEQISEAADLTAYITMKSNHTKLIKNIGNQSHKTPRGNEKAQINNRYCADIIIYQLEYQIQQINEELINRQVKNIAQSGSSKNQDNFENN